MRGYKNFEGTPHPGDLCHLVEIGYTENAINENGYPEPKDVVLCRVWASAVDAGNQPRELCSRYVQSLDFMALPIERSFEAIGIPSHWFPWLILQIDICRQGRTDLLRALLWV